MPKIFITGSNTTRGLKTGSGYISNPVRHLIREKDNRSGEYPSKLRFGTRDRLGNNPVSFNDDNTLKYGQSIQDSFKFKNNASSILKTSPNTSEWDISNGIEIRREHFPSSKDFNDGALVFSGIGDGGSRWLKTKKKIKNPTLIFEVLQGPYKIQDKLLNLGQGQITDILKVQISANGTSAWTDVLINDSNVSNTAFLKGNNHLTPIFDNKSLRIDQESGLDKRSKKPICKVKLDINSFKLNGSDFYLRIIQTAISDSSVAVWALKNIKIISRSDVLEYPLLAAQSVQSFSLSLTGSIATPNTYSSITAAGASIKNLTDKFSYFDSFDSNIQSFKDNSQVENNGEDFYEKGVSEDVLPGFSSRLMSKDIIEVDLSANEQIDFLKLSISPASGFFHAITGSGDLGSNIMAYWNNNLKRWEKIGWPIGINDYGADTASANIVNVLSASAVGFSSVGVIASGSGTTTAADPTANFLPDSLLNSYNRPTDTFGFPFSGRYHATGSQYITARDLGITKPFIFEKASLNFEMSGKINADFGGFDAIYMQNNNYSESTASQAVRHGTPTFFILKQKKENHSVKIDVLTGSNENDIVSYTETLPENRQLVSGSSALTFVDNTRELVSYGQHTIIMSSSHAGSTNYTPTIKFDDFLASPIVRKDRTVFRTANNLSSAPAFFTGSFSINFPARNTSRISAFSPYYVVNTPGALGGGSGYSTYANIRMGKQLSGRSSGELNQESRALVNSFSAFTPSKDIISVQYSDRPQAAGGNSLFTNPVVVAEGEGVDLTSPYIIMPDDKLIFGWQAPLSYRRITADLDTSYITLFGNSKLRLYGSLVKDNKEKHEGLNQNLTSNSIYEAIGSDIVLDQFQLATRGELTGSIHAETYQGVSGAAVFAGLIFPSFVKNSSAVNRVGALSISSLDTGWSSSSGYVRGLFLKNVFNILSHDPKRVFADCFLIKASQVTSYEGNLLKDGGTDGVFVSQGYGFIPSIVSPPLESKTGLHEYYGVSPQYSFNSSHFGFYSDLIQQGRDGKFVDDPTTTADDITSSSPIQIKFVDSEYIDQDLGFRRFNLIESSVMNGKTDSQYQSSNLSLHATSSIGFKDDGTARNRVYG